MLLSDGFLIVMLSVPDEVIETPDALPPFECLGASMVGCPEEYPITAYGSKYILVKPWLLAGLYSSSSFALMFLQ